MNKTEQKVRAFESTMRKQWGKQVVFPEAYVKWAAAPETKLKTFKAGQKNLTIASKVHYGGVQELSGKPQKPWRSWSTAVDARMDYAAKAFIDNEFWSMRFDESGDLLPIAIIGMDWAEMESSDVLCLDYRDTLENPAVVQWIFPGFKVEKVAKSFDAFLALL